MRRLLKNRVGTAEIVGTVLFLVILFFFFSNVFLWHNQVTREVDQVVANKANSPVRVEVIAGAGALCSGEDIDSGNEGFGSYQSAWQLDGIFRAIEEEEYTVGNSVRYRLNVSYTFRTGVDTLEKLEQAESISLNVMANFTDANSEGCSIFVMDCTEGNWVELLVMQEQGWHNVTLSKPERYVDYRNGGEVSVMFVDQSSQSNVMDNAIGTLYVDYMEVTVGPVVLEVTDLGGTDAALSRVWIVGSNFHVFADLEPWDVWVAGGAQKRIVLGNETKMNGPSVEVDEVNGDIVVYYVPPSSESVTFRVLTKLGNTAACSYSFHH